jgi:hypothetical protein
MSSFDDSLGLLPLDPRYEVVYVSHDSGSDVINIVTTGYLGTCTEDCRSHDSHMLPCRYSHPAVLDNQIYL